MEQARGADYKKDLRHRLLALGISDDEFLERFSERHNVEDSLSTASNRGPAFYEEELDTLVDIAEADYDHYGTEWSGRVEEGDIPPKKAPKKKRRVRKSKDIAGMWERQEALGRYLAEVASEDERIIGFRKNVLSERVLSEEEASIFLSSPLAAAKSRFKMLGANPMKRILDTNYQLKDDQDDSGPYRKLVWGGRRSYTVRPLGVVAMKLIFPGDVVTQDDLRGLRLRQGRFVVFLHPREEGRVVVAEARSILGGLANLTERSLGGYPITREMGIWFILTGEFATEDPVRIRYKTIRRPELLSRTTIALEVESWLPPEEVLEQYRHAQHQVLGGTPRSLKRRTLALFDFVNRHKGNSWSELFGAWNKAHSRQRFRDRSHLFTTYTRALEYIAGVKPTKDKNEAAKAVGTDSHGWPIFAEKWHLLHKNGYTGYFDSREEAEADPRRGSSEVLAAEELVARLAERTKNN